MCLYTIGHVRFSAACKSCLVCQVVGIVIIHLFRNSGTFGVPQGYNTTAYLDWNFQAFYSRCMHCVLNDNMHLASP